MEGSLESVRAGVASERQVFGLDSFIDDATHTAALDPRAGRCKLLVEDVDSELGIRGNRQLLLDAVGNLLQNAFKFTQGATVVTLRTSASARHVSIEISDQCGGLPKGSTEKMFAPFRQHGADRTGLGLGLVVARQTIEADSGTLTVRDVPGVGCVFVIRMPRHTAPSFRGQDLAPTPCPTDLQSREGDLSRREAAVRLREESLRRREAALDPSRAATAVLASHIEALHHANEKLALATRLADELRVQAQMAKLRQDEFLAMLAHELRYPLAPICSAVEIIALHEGSPSMTRNLGIVRRRVSHMVRLIDDLLDVSRITRGRVVLQRRPVSVEELVASGLETCREQVASRRQSLSVELPGEPVKVDGDFVRLSQVISNVLQNASKYTPEEGRISVHAAVKEGNVEITVADNGEGISAPTLPRVFDLFVQGERTLDRAQGGLGIGLTVVKEPGRPAWRHGRGAK